MARVFYAGQEFTENDLVLTYRNSAQILTDPNELTYAIIDFTQGYEVIVDNITNRVPVRLSTGKWYAPYKIKDDAAVGEYRLRWYIKETPLSSVVEAQDFFHVVKDSTITKNDYPPKVESMIHRLRIFLGDNDPDRNYRFAPPASVNEVAGFTTNHGYLWQDYELIASLQYAVEDISYSARNVRQNFTIDGVTPALIPTVIVGAAYYAIHHMSMIWIQDEFGYSLNGISLDLTKAQKYNEMMTNLRDQFTQAKENIQANRSHISKGLKQSAYSVGYGYGQGRYTWKGAGAGSWRRT